jgi:hypothetical protein
MCLQVNNTKKERRGKHRRVRQVIQQDDLVFLSARIDCTFKSLASLIGSIVLRTVSEDSDDVFPPPKKKEMPDETAIPGSFFFFTTLLLLCG